MMTVFRLRNMPLIRTALANPLFSAKVYLYRNVVLAGEFRQLKGMLYTEYSKSEVENSFAGAGLSYKEATMYLLVRKYRPELMVETGVANGATSYCILRAMRDNGRGRLISIDYPLYRPAAGDPFRLPRGKRPGWIVPKELRKRWKLMLGRTSEILPRLGVGRKIDVFFHDSEHSYKNMTFEYGWALKHVRNSGIILSDDTNWNSAFRDFLAANRASLKLLKIPVYGGLRVLRRP
jgi:predicted O-methyltransferase YrrM